MKKMNLPVINGGIFLRNFPEVHSSEAKLCFVLQHVTAGRASQESSFSLHRQAEVKHFRRRRINFTKMVASGNDFVVVRLSRYPLPVRQAGFIPLKKLAEEICNRKYGAGADGLLALEKSKAADIKMRIFNADGSEAQMCGNGARCIGFYIGKPNVKIETKAGIIEAKITNGSVKIKLTNPKGIKLDLPVRINNRVLRVNFINIGVPHAVIFVEGIDKIDVVALGRQIRFHPKFKPAGANVDFVEVLNSHSIRVRTYERGVEDETLACGTGAVASAIITSAKLLNWQTGEHKINVHTKSGELLKVNFICDHRDINNVWLEGKVKIVYKGEYYV